MGLQGVVDHQGNLGFGWIVEHLVVGHADQLAVHEGAECTPVGVIHRGQAGDEGAQVRRSEGEKPQVPVPFRQLLMQPQHCGRVAGVQLPDRDDPAVAQQCLSRGYRHG
jgi:hypothetical protein